MGEDERALLRDAVRVMFIEVNGRAPSDEAVEQFVERLVDFIRFGAAFQ
jgi:uncharacterized protein YneF (UPF0154 family)